MVLQQVQNGQLVNVPNMPSPLNAWTFGDVVGDTVNYFLTTILPLPCESCTLNPWMGGQTNLLTVPIYCTIVQKAPWLYDFVYYTFYPYNGGKTISGTNYGNHVGDWEHITVRLNLINPNNPIPTYYGSQHEGGEWCYDLNSSECLFLDNSYRVQLNGTHPIWYSAVGSHAYYPAAGNTVYENITILNINLITLTDNHDGQNPYVWYTWNNVAVRFATDPANGAWNWWNYAGRWGNPEGTTQTFGQYILEPGPSSPNSNTGAFVANDYGAPMQ